uniref:Uncharacterized protein n=1 Tax=Romanomermis culicivorax TaxID=13658 RepID=A0A915KE74_ROMCU
KKIRFGFLEQPLSRLCFKYAWFVADHPWPFILVPILITICCGYGYLNKYDVDDINKYYVPMDAQGLTERAVITELFPPLNGTYVPSRSINEDGQVVIIVTAQDEGNILSMRSLVAENMKGVNGSSEEKSSKFPPQKWEKLYKKRCFWSKDA